MIVCLQFEGNCTLKIAEFDCYDRSKRIRSPISFLVKDPALYKGHFQLNDHFAESIRWNEWNDRFKYTILRFWNLTIISLKIYNNWIQSIRSLWSYNTVSIWKIKISEDRILSKKIWILSEIILYFAQMIVYDQSRSKTLPPNLVQWSYASCFNSLAIVHLGESVSTFGRVF